MKTDSQQPDSPFRIGESGKYKLLIKDFVRRANYFEYDLIDGEGKMYQARSEKLYPQKQLLRCIVTLKIEYGKLVLVGTVICSKQDLAVDLPKNCSDKRVRDWVSQHTLLKGSPSIVGRSGNYLLTVKDVHSWNGAGDAQFHYILIDNNNAQYHAISSLSYPLDTQLACKIEVQKERKGDIFFVEICDDTTSKSVGEVDGIVIPRHYYTASPVTTRIPVKKDKGKKNEKKQKALNKKLVSTIIRSEKYEKQERYNFTVTSECDMLGNQIVVDKHGAKHLLTGTKTRYSEGDKVRCTVKGFGVKPVGSITGQYLVLSEPRRFNSELVTVRVPYVKTPEKWYSEVQYFDKHKCGKPFTCNCCKRSFPANAGWRVDLKDIYFCNACARKIYEPKGRGSHKFIIYTPMGNKR